MDEQREIAASFEITSIPTLAVVKNGKVTNMAVGARPKDAIVALV